MSNEYWLALLAIVLVGGEVFKLLLKHFIEYIKDLKEESKRKRGDTPTQKIGKESSTAKLPVDIINKINNVDKFATRLMEAHLGLTQDQAQQLAAVFSWISRVDEDGSPLGYVPRSWGDLFARMLELLQSQAHVQKDVIKLLDQIVEAMGSQKHNVGSLKGTIEALTKKIDEFPDKFNSQ